VEKKNRRIAPAGCEKRGSRRRPAEPVKKEYDSKINDGGHQEIRSRQQPAGRTQKQGPGDDREGLHEKLSRGPGPKTSEAWRESLRSAAGAL